jgi:Protease subunit of ATP-dependent Clp proteases
MKREGYILRFEMKAENDTAEIMVYSEIANEKWWGDETTTGDFDKALKEARKNGATKLNLRINSGGGEVYAAVAMRSMIINAGFESVRVMIEGLCASAATLFATIPDAKVVIAEGSEFMIHNPMTIAWGNAEEITKTVDHLHKLEEQFHGMYAARTGASEDTIKEWMDAETWFTAKEACEAGFCDEMLSTGKVAACVSERDMEIMKMIYRAVPNTIAILPEEKVSNVSPHDGDATEINDPEEDVPVMDIKDISMEQLRAENPALVDEIIKGAVEDERARISDIDALTVPGYEAMAEEAKAAGTSAIDFQKQVVAAMKKKGADFIKARQDETAPAKDVAGGAPKDSARDEEEELKDAAKGIAGYAEEYTGSALSGMY